MPSIPINRRPPESSKSNDLISENRRPRSQEIDDMKQLPKKLKQIQVTTKNIEIIY